MANLNNKIKWTLYLKRRNFFNLKSVSQKITLKYMSARKLSM